MEATEELKQACREYDKYKSNQHLEIIKNKMIKQKMPIKPKVKPTAEEAALVLQEIQQAKFDACQKELAAVLEKHGYQISVQAQPILVPVSK
jgi:hypothetical protein